MKNNIWLCKTCESWGGQFCWRFSQTDGSGDLEGLQFSILTDDSWNYTVGKHYEMSLTQVKDGY